MAEISIPGDPGGLSALGSQLRAAGEQIAAVQHRVGTNSLQGSWSGQAAEAFRASLKPLPGELSSVFTAFDEAGQALSTFAAKLAELQQKARWYNQQIEAAQQEQNAAQARQQQAQTELDAARLKHSAASDPASLHTASQAVDLGESAVRQAVSDVEETAQTMSRLVAATVTLRQEYESAVSACCGALDGARHAGGSVLAAIGRAIFGIAGHVDGQLAVWWQMGGRRLEEVADKAHGLFDLGDALVEGLVPVSMLGAWATPLVRAANSRFFIRAGRVLWGYDSYKDFREALAESRGENGFGRTVTMGLTGAADAFLLWRPAALTDAATDGMLSGSMKGVALIDGKAISGGTDGASAAYRQDAADRASGNYVGLAVHVAGGFVGGSAQGALQGDDQFAQNAVSGQYGGAVKYIAKGENWAIDKAYAGAGVATGAVEDVWHEGGNLLGKL